MGKRASSGPSVIESRPIDFSNAVHLVTQSKGGVGKSLVAKCIAEYIKDGGRTPVCFDADPSNQTLTKIKALGVTPVSLLVDGDIDRRKFDTLVNEITAQSGPFVVDTGSSSFYAIWDYIVQNDLFELFEEYHRDVVLHVPIAPPPDLEDTIAAFSDICALSPDKSVVAWLNERTEPIVMGGKLFEESEVAAAHQDKLLAAVLIRHRPSCYHTPDISEMLKSGKTFSEMVFEKDTASKRRYRVVRDEIYAQLGRIGI